MNTAAPHPSPAEHWADPASPGSAAARPRLSQRHNAMLAEMGVHVWWEQAEVAPAAPAAPKAPPPAAAAVAHTASAPGPAPVQAPAPAPHNRAVPQPLALTRPADLPSLEALEEAVRSCTGCALAGTRRCAVPGSGDTRPDWLLVGEGPGEEEDFQGLPFVGRAGQLLDRMLRAMQLSRAEKVYITNVVKCRPPQNRNPEPAEMDACTPYLLRQVQLLQPRIVLAMGRFAAQTVLSHNEAGGTPSAQELQKMPLGKLRGQVFRTVVAGRALPVVVTYHPAYLLRNPAEKAKVWADLCLAMETLEKDNAQG